MLVPNEPTLHERDNSHALVVSQRVQQLRALPASSHNDHDDHDDHDDHELIIHALCRAAAELLDDRSALSRQLRNELIESTRLHPAMIEWGLTTTLTSVQATVLRELLWAAQVSTTSRPVAHRLVAVVLAGNLFSAALRALFLPLLTGAHVIAKAAHHDAALPQALKRALDAVDPEIGQRLQIVQFDRHDRTATQALLAHADAVSAYGDDSSLRALSSQLRPRTRFIAHGHGLSAAFIGRDQLASERTARDAADRVALDVAAYDQRGCLSPHAIFVEAGAAIDAATFARLLAHESLPLLQQLLPAGMLSAAERAACLQWQAVAAVRGELLASPEYAVSIESEQPARPSPGGRQIGVYSCADLNALPAALDSFSPYLKCLGVAAAPNIRAQCAQLLRPLGQPRVCRIGEMQTPAFDAYADGRAPLDGLLNSST